MTRTMTDEGRNGKERRAAMLAAARDEYVSEASRGRAGRTVVARYADRLDVLIGGLVAQARDETTVAVAVCAVGGYGRLRALCLHSDLDLLIVFNGEIGPAEERFVKAVLQPFGMLGWKSGSMSASWRSSTTSIWVTRSSCCRSWTCGLWPAIRKPGWFRVRVL